MINDMGYCEYTIADYLDSKDSIIAKLAAIDVLQDKMLASMTDNLDTSGANISMYELDDGQVRVKTGYRSMAELTAGYDALEKIRLRYLNRLRGRTIVLQDKGTFNPGGWRY